MTKNRSAPPRQIRRLRAIPEEKTMTLRERMRPAVTTVGESARTALILNRLAAGGGARALARSLRHEPRCTDWSLPFAGVVEMMLLGTPNGEIQAQAIRDSLDRVSLLNAARPVAREVVDLGSFRGEWLGTAPPGGSVLLYLHGGGYVSGSPATHRSLMVHLGQAANARVFAPDYRLAPEYPYPTALEDAWVAYWWLLAQGIAPGRIVVAGDSAGGGLTVALMLALRAAGLPLPAGGICLSPWFDLALTGESMTTNDHSDYLNDAILRASAAMYLGDHDVCDPLVSPLYADLRGLPPLLIQVGTAEMLLDDGRRFTARARAAGVDVTLEQYAGMVHVWHFTYLVEPRARQAVAAFGQFVAQQTKIK
jgi:acetyl esterase/lipase